MSTLANKTGKTTTSINYSTYTIAPIFLMNFPYWMHSCSALFHAYIQMCKHMPTYLHKYVLSAIRDPFYYWKNFYIAQLPFKWVVGK